MVRDSPLDDFINRLATIGEHGDHMAAPSFRLYIYLCRQLERTLSANVANIQSHQQPSVGWERS